MNEGLVIEDNYFSHLTNTVAYLPIKFESSAGSEVFGLSFKGNKFLHTVEPNVLADFGGGLASDCIVAPMFRLWANHDFAQTLRYINLGLAKFDYVKSLTLSGYFLSKVGGGISYDSVYKSNNIQTSKSNVKFPLSLPIYAQPLQISVPVETDASDYTITLRIFTRDANGTGVYQEMINVSATQSGNKLVKTNLLIAYAATESLRVKMSNADMFLDISVSIPTQGSYFYLGNPTVFYNCA